MSDYYYHHHQFPHQPDFQQPQPPYVGPESYEHPQTEQLLDWQQPYQRSISAVNNSWIGLPREESPRDSAIAPPSLRPPAQPEPDPDPPYSLPDYGDHFPNPYQQSLQPYYQPPHERPNSSRYNNRQTGSFTQPYITNPILGGRSPNAYLHPQPIHTRRPTCWDPPWARQTTAYQQPSSYEPDMYSPPPPRPRPTCWDPPAYWETPGQHHFHEDPAYDQPLPPDPNSRWNQPQPQHHNQPRQSTCWDPPIPHQPLGFWQYDQPPDRQPSCWEPQLTPTVTAIQPHQSYQQPPPLPRSDRPPQQLQPAQTRAPEAYPADVPPPPHAAASRQPAATNVTPLKAAIPPPGSPDIIGEEEVVLHIEEMKNFKDGIDDFSEKTIDSSAGFCDVEKVVIDGHSEVDGDVAKYCDEATSVEAEKDDVPRVKDDVARVREIVEEERSFEACDFDGCLAKTSVKRVGEDAGSLMYPSIPEKLQNLLIDELQDARKEMVNGLKDMSINSYIGGKRMGKLDNKPFHDALTRKFALKDVYIEYAIVGYWGTKQRSFAFDPGGDTSPKLLFSTLVVVSWFPP